MNGTLTIQNQYCRSVFHGYHSTRLQSKELKNIFRVSRINNSVALAHSGTPIPTIVSSAQGTTALFNICQYSSLSVMTCD